MVKEFEAIYSNPIKLSDKEIRTSYAVIIDRDIPIEDSSILGEKIVILEKKEVFGNNEIELGANSFECKRIFCKVIGILRNGKPIQKGQVVELLCKRIKK